MPIGDRKLRTFTALLLCLALFRYLKNKKSSQPGNDSVLQRLKNMSAKRVLDETKEYCVSFCKRRPIMAALIALELGSWAYLGLNRFRKSILWHNTVLELEIKGDYTMVRSTRFFSKFLP